jgi:hypothetical protein
MNEILMICTFVAIMAVLVGYFYIKDGDTNRKFSRYERVVEALVQENHNIKKQLKELQYNKSEIVGVSNVDEILEQISSKIDVQINSKIIPVLNTLQSLENSMNSFQNEQQDKLYSIEERTKSITKLSPNDNNDESKIVAMYQSGKSKENIAKDLRIGIGKVEFVLKFHGIL